MHEYIFLKFVIYETNYWEINQNSNDLLYTETGSSISKLVCISMKFLIISGIIFQFVLCSNCEE